MMQSLTTSRSKLTSRENQNESDSSSRLAAATLSSAPVLGRSANKHSSLRASHSSRISSLNLALGKIAEAVKFPILLRRVEGHSMQPTFTEGQIVFGLTHRQPRRNDVVIAKLDERIEIIKRVVDMRYGLIYLEGDNDGHTKKYSVMPSDIIAVVSTK